MKSNLRRELDEGFLPMKPSLLIEGKKYNYHYTKKSVNCHQSLVLFLYEV